MPLRATECLRPSCDVCRTAFPVLHGSRSAIDLELEDEGWLIDLGDYICPECARGFRNHDEARRYHDGIREAARA